MSKSPLQKFISLIEFDRTIHDATSTIASIDKEITQANLQLLALQKKQETVKNSAYTARSFVDAKELQMKQLDQQEKERKAHLELVKNQREYQSIKAEIENIKAEQSDCEVDLLTAWNQLEKAQKEVTHVEQELQPQFEAIKKSIEELNSKKAEHEKTITQLTSERSARVIDIPEEWLDKYEAMRGRVPNPAVPVINNSCSACYYLLSAENALLLKKKKLLECKSCFRFLYLPEKPPSELSDNEKKESESKEVDA